MKKRILCYGDSNTWGYNPSEPREIHGVAGRYDESIRWPCIMSDLLGEAYSVIEASLVGRTTVFDDPLGPGRNGLEPLECVLMMADPLDFIIVMLGSNDTKDRFCVEAEEIAYGLELVVCRIKSTIALSSGSQNAKLLIVSPPLIGPAADGKYSRGFTERSRDKSLKLAEFYAEVAKKHGCTFLDSALYASGGPEDGVHLTPEAHKTLAKAISAAVQVLPI